MAHFDRGIYEPGEDIRVFDGSEDEEDVEGSRLPLLIVLALLVLAMFAGVVWLAYTQGVARGRTETPVLTAQNGPLRVAPQNSGGTSEPYKGFKIYEQPAPPDGRSGRTTTPAQTRRRLPRRPRLLRRPSLRQARAAACAKTPRTAAGACAQIVAAPAASRKPGARPPNRHRSPPKPRRRCQTGRAKPAAGPGSACRPPPPRRASLAPATGAPKRRRPPPPPAPAAATGGAVLQIGAYKSQAEADAAWKTYKAKHAALLASATNNVQQADLGDKGTWYRLRLTGFPSKDVASAMCDRLKADGGGCFLGK